MKFLSTKILPESSFFSQFDLITISSLPNLLICRNVYSLEHFERRLFDVYNICFPDSLNRAVNKRRAEFLAGRCAASSVLSHLGYKNTRVPVGKHRSPIWPNEIIGSITHTNTSALCAVANTKDRVFLGIDLENWLTDETIRATKRLIIQEREERLLKNSAMNFNEAMTLVFSAKESLFKALYPRVRDYFDFLAVEIVGISVEQRHFELRLCQNLSSDLTIGRCFKGHFKLEAGAILTLITD